MDALSARLTPAELLMHRMHEQTGGGMIVSGVARFVGCLPQTAVADALLILQQRHPALRATIHDQQGFAFFAEPATPAPIPLQWSETNDLEEWSRASLQIAATPFEVRQGPLARLQVLHHPQHQLTDVLLASHHAVADGRSQTSLFTELARLCAGETLPPASITDQRPLPRVPTQLGIVRPMLGAIGQRIRQRRALRTFPLAQIPRTPQSVEVLRRRVWTSEGTARLRERARREQTTVFGALAASSILALCELHEVRGRSVRMRSPLDIRALCEPPIGSDQAGCYAAMLEFVLLRADQQPFWELARQAVAEVHRYLKTGLWAAGWRLLGFALQRGRIPPVRPAFLTVNNLGVIDDVVTSQTRLLEYGWTVNQQNMAMNLMLAAVTVQGALNLTIRSPWHTEAEVEVLFDSMLRQLELASV